MLSRIFVLTALVAASLTALAQSSPVGQNVPVPDALKPPLSQGMKVYKSFNGPSGLTGWVLLQSSNQPVIVFTTTDGKTLISGALIDTSGRNLIPGYAEAETPKADFSSDVPALAAAPAVVQGDPEGKNVIYVFFDPTCHYCNVTYLALKASLRKGTRVHWIPTPVLAPNSAGQSAAIYDAQDSAAALDAHELAYAQGGIKPIAVSSETKQQFDANIKLFHAMKFQGVPAIVYQTPEGRWDAVNSAPTPRDLVKMLATK